MMYRNNLRDYLKSIGDIPQLTAEQEKEYAFNMMPYAKGYKVVQETPEKATDKDREDAEQYVYWRNKLVEPNLKFVVFIVKKYRNERLSLNDLIEEGNSGLIMAAEKFDPTLGFRFTTFASSWIKQAASKAITEQGRGIRLPAHMFQLLAKYKKCITELQGQGVQLTDELIAQKMGITVEKVQLLRENKHDTLSLEQKLGADEDSDTLADLVPDKNKTPEEYTFEALRRRQLLDAMKVLKPRDQQIIKMRFGVCEEGDPDEWKHEHTLEEVGKAVGLTRERIRQIEKASLAAMKPYITMK